MPESTLGYLFACFPNESRVGLETILYTNYRKVWAESTSHAVVGFQNVLLACSRV